MSAEATERWSDRKRTEVIDGNFTAMRGWDVVGFSDEDDAIAATNVAPGDPHPLAPYLKCLNIALTENKFTLGRVIANYGITSLQPDSPIPTERRPKILWKRGHVSMPIDTDWNGIPILNSAGDAFTGTMTRQFPVRYFQLTRYEAYYDQDIANQFIDTVCKDGCSFEGNDFGAGQVLMTNYAPTSAYQEGASYVEVVYEFEIRTWDMSGLTDLQKRHPFQRRLLDQGLRAKYNNPSLGQTFGSFYLASHDPVSRDVLLKGDGTPIDGSIKVTAGAVAPIVQTLNPKVVVDKVSSAGTLKAVFLIYMDHAESDFSSIGVAG